MFRFDGEVFLLGTAIAAPLNASRTTIKIATICASSQRDNPRAAAGSSRTAAPIATGAPSASAPASASISPERPNDCFRPIADIRELIIIVGVKPSVAVLFLSLLSCGQKQYTDEECKALAAPKAYIDRCMGGTIYGQYIGDLKCWPFSEKRLQGVLWGSGNENAAFFPNATSFNETQKLDARIWPVNDPQLVLPPALRNVPAGVPHAWLVDAEGKLSQCDGQFGHLGAYPREFIITKFNSVREIPIR
jgi:hypothetical protein